MLKKMSDEELDIYLGKRSRLELLEFVLTEMLAEKYAHMKIHIYRSIDYKWASDFTPKNGPTFDERRDAVIWAARKAFGDKFINALIAVFTIEE